MTRSAGVRALDLMLAAGVALFASSLVLFRAPWTASALTGLRPEDVLVGLVVLVAARSALSSPRPPAVRPERAVAAGVVAYALVFSFVTVGRGTEPFINTTSRSDAGSPRTGRPVFSMNNTSQYQ